MILRSTNTTRTDTPFPYTLLFRSHRSGHGVAGDRDVVDPLALDGAPHLVGVEAPEHHDDVALEGEPQEAPLGGAVHEGRQVERPQRSLNGLRLFGEGQLVGHPLARV